MNPLLVIAPLFLGIVLLFLNWLRPPIMDSFDITGQRAGLYDRIGRSLNRAGIAAKAGSIVFIALILALFLGTIVFVASGSLIAALLSAPAALVGVYAWVRNRERSFMNRATAELVPFLRRVEAQVRAGQNIQTAFARSTAESTLIRSRIEDLVGQLQLGRPFVEVLRETNDRLPLRSWAQFVRQMELYQSGGGDLGELLSDSVSQINDLIQLQAEIRADYARVSRQQWVLLGIVALAIPALAVAGLIGQLLTSVGGIVILVVAFSLMLGGIIWGQRQVKDIERRLEF